MLDFETVFFSEAQWEYRGVLFGLRTYHGFGSSGATTADGAHLTIDEARDYYANKIQRGRSILWQREIMPAKAYNGHFIWLVDNENGGNGHKIFMDLVSEGEVGTVEVSVYRVRDQKDFNILKGRGLFNPIKGERFVHYIGPNDPIPKLNDVPKYIVLCLTEDRDDLLDGTKFVATFNTYKDAFISANMLNKATKIDNPDLGYEGKYIVVDNYYNKWHPYKAKEECCKPQEFYLELAEALKQRK